MKKDPLGKLYDRLTPEERFRLVVEARVRGDEEESRRLARSAPLYTWTEADPAYTGRLRASRDVTWAVLCLDLLPRLARLRMVGALSEALTLAFSACANEAHLAYLDGHEAGSRHAWEAAGKAGDPPGWGGQGRQRREEDDPGIEEALDRVEGRVRDAPDGFTGLLKGVERGIAAEARALWEAFCRFSDTELGLEPKKLVECWFEQALSEIEELEALTEVVEADRGKTEEVEGLLKEAWGKLLRG